MIFPSLGVPYYNEAHRDLLSRMEAFYAESVTINQAFWSEADTDTRFHAGDQTLWNDLYGNLPANRRRQFNFNHIRRVINMISGHQRRNRKSIIVTGVENADDLTADQFTKIMMWLQQQEGILETISESFEGSLVTGMNFLHVWMDYRQDPVSGNIRVDNCSYNSFLVDPYFRKPDMSDCNAIWKRSFLTKRACISLMPQYAEEISGLWGNDSGTGRDGKFQFMPESYGYSYKNLLTYDEFYYRDFRNQKLLVDSETGETQEWRNQDEKMLKAYLKKYPQIEMIESEVPTVKMAIVIQGKVFYDGPNPMGIDLYPFVPVFTYYAPQMPYFPQRCQGVVRGLRDAQYLYNRRLIIMADIFESQINSGWKYKENALVNPSDIFLTGQGRGLALKEEALMTDVEQIQAPQVPPSMFQLSDAFAKEIISISGVNEELLGSAVDDKAGILSMLRQGAGLVTLQNLFDQLDHAQKLLGRILIELVQANFTPGKVKKILEGEEPTAQFYNKSFGRYDAVVEDGLNTATQKQMNFAQLLQLREVGIPIPDDLLVDAATIQNKNKLVEAIAKNAQMRQQMQQSQAQLSMQELQARAQLAQARARADIGLEQERLSRIPENRALAIQKLHEAKKDDEIGLLNLIKALKEIDSLDVAHLEKLIRLSHEVKAKEEGLGALDMVGQSIPSQQNGSAA
jgi:hypothetical protein